MNQNRSISRAWAVLLGAALAGAILMSRASAGPAVKVVKDPPTAQRKPFAEITPAAAKLAEGHDAYTECYYAAEWYFNYARDNRPPQQSGQHRVRITMRTVSVRLKLATTMWLRPDAAPALVAHEEGHRQIGEMYYRDAEAIAQAVSKRLIGQRFEAEAATADAAEAAAHGQAGDRWLAGYLEQTRDAARPVHELYDEITRMGENPHISVDDAIQWALDRSHSATIRASGCGCGCGCERERDAQGDGHAK